MAIPFNLPWGSSIYVKVSAINAVGTGPDSNLGNGAIIVTSPDAPLSVSDNPAVTTVS